MSEQLNGSEVQTLISQSRFHQLFKPEVISIDYAQLQLTVKMSLSESLERQPGTNQWHGGAIASIIDTVGCYGLALLTHEPLPTINFRTDYLRPAFDRDLTAVATIRRSGRTISVVDVEVSNESAKLVALGRGCYSHYAPHHESSG